MTIEEKREAIEKWCKHSAPHIDCTECPLYYLPEDSCFSDATPKQIEDHYNRLVKAGWIEDVSNNTDSNSVNHPSHYNQGKYECIEVMVETFGREAVRNFCLLNAFKYVWRTGEKNGDEDIEKAIWYLNKHLELGREEV